MTNRAHDYNKTVALLKSVAAPCEIKGGADHAWRKCRHCLAVAELDHSDVRQRLRAFLLAVEVNDKGYGTALAALREVDQHADDECGFMVDVRAALAKVEGVVT